MNLLTYAVSQKLQRNNEMWKFIHSNEPIPHDVVADAFAETLQQYEDLRAERLATDYQSFVSNHLPVTFAPNSNGIHVAGEIQNEALDVIHALYGKTDEDVIRDTIRSSIYAINPGRAIEIDDIQTMADDMHIKAIQRHEQVQKLRQLVHDVPTSATEQPIEHVTEPVVQHLPVDVMDDPATYVSHERQTPLGAAKQALAEAEAEAGEVLHFGEPKTDMPTEVVLTPVEDTPTISKVLTESDEIPQLQDVIEEPEETTDAGVLASAWNNLVQNFKDKGLEDRIALDVPLTFALA